MIQVCVVGGKMASASAREEQATSACRYCREHAQHPQFVYLLTDQRSMTRYNRGEPVGEHHIGMATHPICRMHQNNRVSGYHTGAKATNLQGAHWQLELVIGPFYTGALRFRDAWRKAKRRIMNRYRAVEQLVQARLRDAEFVQRNRGEPLRVYCRDPSFSARVFTRMKAGTSACESVLTDETDSD